MKRVYTGTWSIYKSAPYIMKKGFVIHRRPRFNETVGIIEEFSQNLVSFFEDDIPFQPDSAPVLEGLQEDEKVRVVIDEETEEKNVKLTYIVCRQCSVEFPSTSHNRLYCPECAKSRKKVADSISSRKRVLVANQGSTNLHDTHLNLNRTVKSKSTERPPYENYLNGEFGNIKVLGLASILGNRTSYFCKCNCGTVFIASHTALKSLAIQECPVCMNKKVDFAAELTNERLVDFSVDSWDILHIRRFGLLEAKVKINNSLALCNCGCGKRLVIPTDGLLDGSVKSCGCYDKARDLIPNNEPHTKLVGRKIGYTQVIAESRLYHMTKRPTTKLLNCRCDCGNEFLTTYGNLTNAEHRHFPLSCGCSLKTQKVLKAPEK